METNLEDNNYLDNRSRGLRPLIKTTETPVQLLDWCVLSVETPHQGNITASLPVMAVPDSSRDPSGGS